MLRKTIHIGFIFGLLGLITAVGWSLQAQAIPAARAAPNATSTIRGTIIGLDKGLPLTSDDVSEIVAKRISNGQSYPTPIDSATGGYQIDGLAPGEYTLYFNTHPKRIIIPGGLITRNSRYVSTYYNNALTEQEATIINVMTDTVTVIDQALQIGGSVQGIVTGLTTGEVITKTDISSISVLNLQNNQTGNTTTIRDDGTYQLGKLSTGTYRICVSTTLTSAYADTCYPSSTQEPISITSGITTTFNMELLNKGKIVGTITDSLTGEPINPEHVRYVELNNYFARSINPDSTYEIIPQQSGTYLLRFVAENDSPYLTEYYGGTEFDEFAETIEVNPGDVITIDYGLRRGGVIAGRLTDASTGEPISDTLLYDINATMTAYGGNEYYDLGLDEDGRYEITKLWPGTYRLTFRMRDNHSYANNFYIDPTTNEPIVITVTAGMTATFDYALPQGSILQGTVTDIATGQPITNAANTVEVETFTGQPIGSAPVDEFGNYQVMNLPAGTYNVLFMGGPQFPQNPVYPWPFYHMNEAFPPPLYADSDPISISINAESTITLNHAMREGGIISGVIDYGNTESYSSLISIYPTTCENWHELRRYIRTFDSYSLMGLNDGKYNVIFDRGEEHRNFYDTVTISGSQIVEMNPSFMIPSGRLSGQIKDEETNLPIAGVSVSLWTQHFSENLGHYIYGSQYTTTDENGLYEISNIYADTYLLYFSESSYIPEWHENQPVKWEATRHSASPEQVTPIVITANSDIEVSASLTLGGYISGNLIDSTTGDAPLSEMFLTVYDQISGEMRWAGEVGYSSFETPNLPDGNYLLHFKAVLDDLDHYTRPKLAYYQPTYYTHSDGITPQTITIANGEPVTDIHISLDRGGYISGQLFGEDFYTPDDGLRAIVYLYNANGEKIATTKSQGFAGGYYFAGLEPGTYYIRFGSGQLRAHSQDCAVPDLHYYGIYHGQATTFEGATPIEVSSEESVLINGWLPVEDLGTQPPDTTLYTITGRVTMADGTPVPNTTITANTGQKASTDTNGNYTIKLIKQNYQLTASKPGYTFTTNPLALTVDGNESGQDFTAVPSVTSGIISGSLTDEDTSAPLTDIAISVYQQIDHQWTFVAETTTNTSGQYTVTLHTADFRLHFRDPQNGYQSEYYDDAKQFTAAQTVTLVDGQTVTADAQQAPKRPPKIKVGGGHTITDPDTGKVTIRLTNGSDRAIVISYEPACETGTPTDVTLMAGSAQFPMSDAGNGRYTISLNIPNEISASSDLSIEFKCDGVAQSDDVGRIQLYDPSGLITDINTGSIITNALVTLYRIPNALPDTDTETNQCRTVDTRPTATNGPFGPWSALPAADLAVGIPVNAEIDQLNGYPLFDPAVTTQQTDADGRYGWDVAEGCWFVKVEAQGYETAVSPIVGVPPAVLDLDIALTLETIEMQNPTLYLPLITH